MTIKPIDLLDRIRGWCCPTESHVGPFVRFTVKPHFDENDEHEQGERINGVIECPHCRLMWPLLEQPEAWSQGNDGRWHITEWGPGTAECLQGNRLFVDTFDGCFELKV